MRYLHNVIDQMLAVIPDNYDNLICALKSLRSSAAFAAPEMQPFWWNETYKVLVNYVFGKDVWNDLDWQEKLRKIWTNEK